MTYLIIAVTSVTSLAAMYGRAHNPIRLCSEPARAATRAATSSRVAHGRVLPPDQRHPGPRPDGHLSLALQHVRPVVCRRQLVERMYGSLLMGFFYVLCGVAASVGSFVFGGAAASVGASGAIFGLFGVVLIATRYHHAVLDQQSRAVASQVGIPHSAQPRSGVLGHIPGGQRRPRRRAAGGNVAGADHPADPSPDSGLGLAGSPGGSSPIPGFGPAGPRCRGSGGRHPGGRGHRHESVEQPATIPQRNERKPARISGGAGAGGGGGEPAVVR